MNINTYKEEKTTYRVTIDFTPESIELYRKGIPHIYKCPFASDIIIRIAKE